MKSNFFKPKEDKKEDIINKFFRMENLKNDADIEEKYFASILFFNQRYNFKI